MALCGRRGAALAAVLGHDARARHAIRRAHVAGAEARAAFRLRRRARRQAFRAARQLRARSHPAAGRRDRRRSQAALPDHRSARGARARHRRLQGRFASRRRIARGASRVLRRVFPGSRARPDLARRVRGGAGIRPESARAASGQREAGDRRQLPGRLGGDDARQLVGGRHGPHRHQRGADVVLERGMERRPERQSDALCRRDTGRHLARVVRVGPRPWQVRRRLSRGELRVPEPGEYAVGQVLPRVRQHRHRAAAVPRIRALVGRLLPDEPRGDRMDHAQPVHRQQALVRRSARRRGRVVRPAQDPLADHPVRVDGRQHHAAAAGVQLGGGHLWQHRGNQVARAGDHRPGGRGRGPSRHLRVGQGREKGARADRQRAGCDRNASARPLLDVDPGGEGRRREGHLRGHVRRASSRRDREAFQPLRAQGRSRIRSRRRAVRIHAARV